jgi:hypothetical protein
MGQSFNKRDGTPICRRFDNEKKKLAYYTECGVLPAARLEIRIDRWVRVGGLSSLKAALSFHSLWSMANIVASSIVTSPGQTSDGPKNRISVTPIVG